MTTEMARAKAILQSEFPYNISARCINREWFQIGMPTVWRIFCRELDRTIQDHNLVVHSFVLMSNHFHLIASTPDANISDCMHQFMWRSSRELTKAGNRINETFAGRHFKCILQKPFYFESAYKYNYRNPVSAGICENVEEYPFSSLQFLMKPHSKLFKLNEDTLFQSDPAGILGWLNTKPNAEMLEAFKYGVKHPYFKSKKSKNERVYILNEGQPF